MTAFTDQYGLPNICFDIGQVDSKFAYTHFKYVKKISNEKFLDIRELD
jgi:hypothetical protein